MTSFHVSDFNEKTPLAERTKLKEFLKAVKGVEWVTLRPKSGEVSLTFIPSHCPREEALEGAVARAGFTIKSQLCESNPDAVETSAAAIQ